MTGQNTTVFGIYRDREGVERAVDILRGKGNSREARGALMLSSAAMLDLLKLIKREVRGLLEWPTRSSRSEQVAGKSFPTQDAFERFMTEFTKRSREASARLSK